MFELKPWLGSVAALVTPTPSGDGSQDLSPISMFWNADSVVKAVMIGLACASVATWAVWFAKGLELAVSRYRARRATFALEPAIDLDAARHDLAASGLRRGPVAEMMRAVLAELRLSTDLSPGGVKERAAMALERIEARSARAAARGTGLLATVGATAPFVGLFGTVWGIMNSFVGISRSHTTSLAVVAPGIAEALLATAIGLVAAIPAVVIYNVFARSVAEYRSDLADAASALLRHLSRDLDRRAAEPPAE